MQAVVLAGGFGKRLAPLTSEVPKPLLPVGGRPILVRQIEWLRRYGIVDIVLAVGYLRHKIFEALGDGRKYGVRLFYSVEEEPLGTGGAIKNAAPYITDDVFIVVNGDVLTDLPIEGLVEALEGADGAIALVPLRSPYGVVEFDSSGYISRFREKPLLEGFYINAGVYALRKRVLSELPDRGNIEETLFPSLAKQRRLKAVVFRDVFWRSVDSLKDLEEVDRHFAGNEH
ncbi:nucleotidyltransferase family protein [Pyrobaculum neutrophilum]|uniref:Nucleotidyl transferase n=1 Tax=Pyrobaculum neutrophilum (strain DSM 2338 / JCM 9278 / NBRC 100436 / V24Sta) TaxID=444157 RepID=B1YAX5_PYRNV|nr:nucleotidyltransferase family protein [Pyrobaculum neutrophilum]ACB40675.1 Nucleotidyl transferase [Pyrobaculum neutrophilum V24Sta]